LTIAAIVSVRAVATSPTRPGPRVELTGVNGLPIDVLAQRFNATRGALYKTLHDAHHKLRVHLAAREVSIGEEGREEA
jgi:hypothetical protein